MNVLGNSKRLKNSRLETALNNAGAKMNFNYVLIQQLLFYKHHFLRFSEVPPIYSGKIKSININSAGKF